MATATIPVIDNAVKLRFADALLRTKNPSTAALQVIPNPGIALQQSYILPTDPVVIEEMARLRDEVGEEGLLPTKFEIAREILDRAKLTSDNEDYERLMKLYCSIMGHIERPGTNVGIQVQVAPVMVVKDHGDDEEWAIKAAEQQRRLIADAAE